MSITRKNATWYLNLYLSTKKQVTPRLEDDILYASIITFHDTPLSVFGAKQTRTLRSLSTPPQK